MLVTLNDLLPEAANSPSAVACINVFGFEDARAVLDAAETLDRPVILATNKDMVDLLGVESLAGMLAPMAEASSANVCLHLDHTYEETIVYKAMQSGFSSVMFDGSQLTLDENIRRSRQVAQVAGAFGISLEGEIGSVPYEEGRDHIKSIYTEPEQAQRFGIESGINAMAVAVGNVHRLTTPTCTIDYERLAEIEKLVEIPLVIHGTTGIPEADVIQLKQTQIAKFNVGTSLRMVVGQNLREAMQAEPDQFDRSHFMRQIMPAMRDEAMRIIRVLT
ncbi:MAG: class II fructose-bisphosphate aldolase [Leucothrix sp.]